MRALTMRIRRQYWTWICLVALTSSADSMLNGQELRDAGALSKPSLPTPENNRTLNLERLNQTRNKQGTEKTSPVQGLPSGNVMPSGLGSGIGALPSGLPSSGLAPSGSPTPGFAAGDDPILIQYPETIKSKVKQQGPDGRVQEIEVLQQEMRAVSLNIDTKISEIDLPPDGKRIAVLTITAKRHEKLLQALMDAKTEEEKASATKELKENYIEHYAIESWWRAEKLKELEKRLEEMRTQVKQRQESQEKYVEAAMTIAGLHAQGISIAPPKPRAPEGSAPYGETYGSPIGLPSPSGTGTYSPAPYLNASPTPNNFSNTPSNPSTPYNPSTNAEPKTVNRY